MFSTPYKPNQTGDTVFNSLISVGTIESEQRTHGEKEEERQETINEDPAAQGCISNSHGR